MYKEHLIKDISIDIKQSLVNPPKQNMEEITLFTIFIGFTFKTKRFDSASYYVNRMNAAKCFVNVIA